MTKMVKIDFDSVRKEYTKALLSEDQAGEDPLALFNQWYQQALDSDLIEPNAFCLSTVGSIQGRLQPSSRIVLLKGIIDDKFLFFTNYKSRKGNEIEFCPQVSALFFWDRLERQVRIEGCIKKAERAVAKEYFSKRPIGSQASACISQQSQVVASRQDLEERKAELLSKNNSIECPDHWGGYFIEPHQFEFWQGRQDKLHDRIQYKRLDFGWIRQRLAP